MFLAFITFNKRSFRAKQEQSKLMKLEMITCRFYFQYLLFRTLWTYCLDNVTNRNKKTLPSVMLAKN